MEDFRFCDACKTLYNPEIPHEVSRHRKYHDDFVNGVRVNKLRSDETLTQSQQIKVILVTPISSIWQRKRINRIVRLAKSDIDDFNFSLFFDNRRNTPLVFVGVKDNRALALLVLHKVDRTCKMTWSEYEENDSGILSPDTRWSIALIWTLGKYRREGYAKLLAEVASEYVKVPLSEIAWLLPFTDLGEQFAKTVSPTYAYMTWK